MTKTAFVLLLLLGACAAPQVPTDPIGFSPPPNADTELEDPLYSIHLFRHAEKQTGPDPALTQNGLARAEFIAMRMSHADMDISAVWSSDYQRTRMTAQPLAERLGVEMKLYDPRDSHALIEKLKAAGVDSVVIGHSNTVPELAALLCQCDVEPMDESQYERGYVVAMGAGAQYLYEIDMRSIWTNRAAEH